MVLSKKQITKGADETARMRRPVCACVVPKPPKTGFLAARPIYFQARVENRVDTDALMVSPETFK